MKTEIYKGCKIKSTPNQLVEDEEGYKYAVNGIIEINSGSNTTDVMIQNLNIPNNERRHLIEDDADATFIKYSKVFVDDNITLD